MPDTTRDDIAKLQQEYTKNPEGRVFVHLAQAYQRNGEAGRARDLLREGLKHHPDYVSAHVVLGEVQTQLGDEHEAVSAWQRALELDPENETALRGLVDLETRQGRQEQALEYLQRLADLGIDDEELEARMATLTEDGDGQARQADPVEPARAVNAAAAEQRGDARTVAARPAERGAPSATDAIALSDLLVRLLEFRDSTFHSTSSLTRVLALAIGEELELDPVHLDALSLAALLSDLAGVALTGNSAASLRGDEEAFRRAEQREVAISLQMLEGIALPPGVHEAIRHQHERWDGTGYPDGLREEDIPYGARVLAVARACATMLTSNQGRTGTVSGALDEMQRNAGSRFDPVVVSVLRRVFQRRAEHGIGYGLGGHVIIVHPEELRTLGLGAELHKGGYVTEMVPEPARARESLRGGPAKALVLGAGLPLTDLTRFVRDVRANPTTVRTPVIVIDANDMDLRIELLTAGADVCFPSEVTFREFKATLDALLRRTEEGGATQEVGYRAAEALA